MNPCPCGWAGDASGRCRCNSDAIARYRGRISGPLLDRIDLHVTLARLPPAELRMDRPAGECSAVVRRRVETARARQLARCGKPNGRMSQVETFATCRLGEGDQALLEQASERLQLSARSAVRIVRTARTIADLDGAETIATPHLAEAIGYRTLERPPAGTATRVAA